jgi:hypothetical protein
VYLVAGDLRTTIPTDAMIRVDKEYITMRVKKISGKKVLARAESPPYPLVAWSVKYRH